MHLIEVTPEAINRAAASIPAGQPIVMLNMLHFREQAQYGNQPNESVSGRDVYYQRYLPAWGKLASAVPGVKVLFLSAVQAGLVISPEEIWDEVALVEYPSMKAFQSIAESKAYQAEADPHRKAALKDWRLIAMTKETPPQS